ncbi:MAG TPA: hypothetical protein VII73_13490 [Caulobacteraceae bacterium]
MAAKTTFMALAAGFALLLGASAAPTAALAGGSGSGGGCNCTPTPPPPPVAPCNCTPPSGPNINIPGVNVFVAPSVIVNANVNAQAAAATNASGSTYFGGGGGGSYIAPQATGLISGLNVEGIAQRASYEATRTLYKKVVIQAFCFDDRDVPHPASQVLPDRDIDDAYDGELYRCIAGAHMQVTIADWKQQISFAGGQTLACGKGDALYHFPGAPGSGGRIACRPQKPARDCNERSLLRRFGAGIKILSIMVTEKYTAYREEKSSSSTAMGMSLDGGVGGVAY